MPTNSTIIRPDTLARDLGVSTRTLKRWQKSVGFPPARRLGKRAKGYLRSEVEEWVDTRPAVTPTITQDQG